MKNKTLVTRNKWGYFNLMFIPFIFSLLFVCQSYVNINKRYIYWYEGLKLEWDYFNGQIPKDSIEFGAVTKYGYEYYTLETEDSLYAVVSKLYFDRQNSWVHIRSDNLLKHEQGHFDLAAVYLKKFREKLYLNKNNIKGINDCNVIFDEIKKEHDSIQQVYEMKTDYSRNVYNQAIFNDSIRFWLDELDNYNDTIIFF